mgnify:FL=1
MIGSTLRWTVFVYLGSASRIFISIYFDVRVQEVVIVICYFGEMFIAGGVQESRDCWQCKMVLYKGSLLGFLIDRSLLWTQFAHNKF